MKTNQDSPMWFEQVGCGWPECTCVVPLENWSHEKRRNCCVKWKFFGEDLDDQSS